METKRWKQISIIRNGKNNLELLIDYILVGGLAMVLHGLPRATVDIDVTIPAIPQEIKKIQQLRSLLGYSTNESLLELAMKSPGQAIGQCLTLKDCNDVFHLDLFFTSEVDFKELKTNVHFFDFEEISLNVASLKDIKKLKEKYNRQADKADIELINKKFSNNRHYRQIYLCPSFSFSAIERNDKI